MTSNLDAMEAVRLADEWAAKEDCASDRVQGPETIGTEWGADLIARHRQNAAVLRTLIARIRELEGEVVGASQDHAPTAGDARPSTRAEGWVLVPVEPNISMLNAATDATGAGSDMSWSNRSPQRLFEQAWSAMIAARPHD